MSSRGRSRRVMLLFPAVLALASCVDQGGGIGTQGPVSGETDRVRRFPAAQEQLYQVSIVGGDDFYEVEIGALVGLTLRTATAKVSDAQFPVLEEYVFETAPTCEALGFAKIVRNPGAEHFKSCVIHCDKSGL